MKRALVTGGAGFIGGHIADALLENGYEVVVIDNESTGFRENIPQGAYFISGDIRNRKDLEQAFDGGIDVVLHLAAQSSNIRSFHDPYADINTNIVGTVNIVEMCLKRKVPRLLYASSMTCYGHPEKILISENDPCRPVSYYGITKYTAERYIHATAERNDLDFDFNVTSFRMFNVYGERQCLDNPYLGVAAIFISNIMNGIPVTIHSDGEQTRDFVYIEDVVSAWLVAINNQRTYGEIFNIGFGRDISINQLAELVLKSNGKDRKNYSVQYSPKRPGDQRKTRADISKAREILGWVPETALEEGMNRTIEWANGHWHKKIYT
jgi:UDP-glucose 4-epimerase